jgi:acetyl-CoA synthetase/medium-chain acyl-CoA synthetase
VTPDVPPHFNFAHDVIERLAQTTPDALALWWIDEGTVPERKITFAEMGNLLRQAANFFESCGIRRGDPVLIMLQRVPQWWIAMLGLIRLGAIPIPATPLLTTRDIQYRLECAAMRAVITDVPGTEKIEQFNGIRIIVGGKSDAWIDFDHGLAAALSQRAYEPTRSDDPMMVFFTSGTAGEAKMVLHTHASYGIGHNITGKHWLDLHPGEICWTLADTGWAKSSWSSLFGPWSQGATVFTMDMRGKFEPGAILKTLSTYPINVFCAPATALRLIVRKDLSEYSFPHLRHCVSAGEALNPPVLEIWKQATRLTIHEGYGQTETVCMIGNFRAQGHAVRPGSMGRAAPGYEICIVDEDGNELPAGKVGQIAVRVNPRRPIALFKEYWHNPAETATRYLLDWYLTGDTAYRDADGYFWFVGRADDVINSSSYRIGPSEVESALLEHPAILEAGAIGVPDELRGEIVKAYIVLRHGFEPSDQLKRELQAHCKRVTAPYKYPRQIEFIDELPKTTSGKIRRVELRARDRAARMGGGSSK